MSFDILIPDISNKPKNTKDAVISILTLEWPLTLRNIFYKIKKQYNYPFTYQSVYKAVKELSEREILLKKNKKYEVSIGWVKKLQSFTDIVETNYYAKERVRAILGLKESKTEKDMMILNFDSIFDAEKYLYYFMKTELFKTKNDFICYQINHEWRPLFYLRAEYNYYRRLIKKGHKFYFICSGNSYLEKEYKKFYTSIGVNYKIINQSFPSNNLVFGEYFIQIFIPEDLKNKMTHYLNKKDAMALLEGVLNKESSIKLIVNKDVSLANEFRKQFLNNYFSSMKE